jgi:hypothetical protein
MKAKLFMLDCTRMSEELLRAHVESGRFVVDATTNLPDGHVVSLKVVPNDDMTSEERARLHAALHESLDDVEGGRGSDMAEFLEELKAEP